MTTRCPHGAAPALHSLFADMRARAARLAPLASPSGRIALLNLDLLAPLLGEAATLPLLTVLLSPAEAAILAGFRFPKRRLEWLGGRLAGKYCLALLADAGKEPNLSSFGDSSILPDDHGRPRVHASGWHGSAPGLSISHSRGFAAALAVGRGPCGLDIQYPAAKLFSVQERFATDGELARMEGIPDPLTRLTALWTIKEAVKKGLLSDRPTFLGRVGLAALTGKDGAGHWTAACTIADGEPATVTVRVAETEGYLVACTLGEACA